MLSREGTLGRPAAAWRSARSVLRSFGRAKGFVVAAVLTVALGIGVNNVVFSLFDGLLFRPLPYSEPNRLVQLYSVEATPTRAYHTQHLAVTLELARERDLFSGIAWAEGGNVVPVVPTSGENPILWLTGVTSNALDVLGVTPAIGPGFSAFEATPLERPVLLTHDVWQGRFGGADNVLSLEWVARDANGQDIVWRVVGVLPQGFVLPSSRLTTAEFDGIYGIDPGLDRHPTIRFVGAAPFARLAPGVSLSEARARVRTLVASRFPGLTNYLTFERATVNVAPLQAGHATVARSYAWLAVLGAWAVLGVTCITLAILLVTWSQTRRKDAGVRLALGASPRRLLLGALSETVLLCGLGATVGWLAYMWTHSLFANLLPPGFQAYATGAVEPRVVILTCGIAMVSAAVAGIFPAVQITRSFPMVALRGASGTTEFDRITGGPALLTVQAAVGVVVLVCAAAVVPPVLRTLSRPAGFDPADLYVVEVPTANDRSAADAYEQVRRGREALEIARALPGVTDAALVKGNPFWPGSIERQRLQGLPGPAQSEARLSPGSPIEFPGRILPVDPGFFATLRTPLVAGRVFTEAEIDQQAAVAVVNEAAIGLFSPGSSADAMIGRTVATSGGPRTIVGVAADFRVDMGTHGTATAFVPVSTNEAYEASVSNPYPWNSYEVILRMAPGRIPDVALLSDRLRERPWMVPRWVGARRESVAQALTLELASPRLLALIFGTLGGTTLVLTVIAIYGLSSFEIRRRRADLTVRLALGATPGLLRRRMAASLAKPIVVGLLAGLPLSWMAAVILSRAVGVFDAADPLVYAGAAILIAGAALIAAWIPGRRHLTGRVAELLRTS